MRIVPTTRTSACGKIPIIYDAKSHQPIYVNVERFNNEIGFIMHNYETFNYKEWRAVSPEVRELLREYFSVSSKCYLTYFRLYFFFID